MADNVSVKSTNARVGIQGLRRKAFFSEIRAQIGMAQLPSSDQSKIESVEEIANRLNSATQHIDKDRLIAAPDCGLAMLGRELAMNKLTNLCEAANQI